MELAFPKPIRTKYGKAMEQHSLRREIIATQLSNILVNEMGFTFVYRLQNESGASVAAIMRAYTIVRTIFNTPDLWQQIEALDNVVSTQQQTVMLMKICRMLRRTTGWMIQNRLTQLDITTEITTFADGVARLRNHLDQFLTPHQQEEMQQQIAEYTAAGVPASLAGELASIPMLFSAMDIIEIANQLNRPINEVASVYVTIGEQFELRWIRYHVIVHKVDNHWEALAREALRDDLDLQQRMLAANILQFDSSAESVQERVTQWMTRYKPCIERWQRLLMELQTNPSVNLTMFFVAIRELHDVAHMCKPVTTVNKTKKAGTRKKTK
ncbi:MAG: hypothetical protein GKR77_06725 [Legionellales bacterium]|nr:hypothetical protein [Legionellales bacterium]